MQNRNLPSIVTPMMRRYILGTLGLLFLVFFGIWEVLNYWTTEQGATMMMGYSTEQIGWTLSYAGWWVRYLALAMVGLDVLHLLIFFLDRLVPDIIPEEANVITWAAWGIVTFADIMFSVYTFGYNFEQGVAAGTTRGPQVFAEFLQYAPFVVSFMAWGMTFFMVSVGRSFLASAFGLPARPARAPRLYIPRFGGGGGGQAPQGKGQQQPPPKQQQPPAPPKQQYTPPSNPKPAFRPVSAPMPMSGGEPKLNEVPMSDAARKAIDDAMSAIDGHRGVSA